MDKWESNLSCATTCHRCNIALGYQDRRILSVYDHEPVCIDCKKKEEQRPDYEEVSRRMIGTCMAETEVMYSDPGGFCFHHFYPFSCK
jgi:hypothetical protein